MSDAERKAASDARTAPVAVWQILEKLKGQDLADWRLANVENRASIEERNLNIGIPFGWYPLVLAKDLAVGEVKPLRYFSKDLAMWRGEDGEEHQRRICARQDHRAQRMPPRQMVQDGEPDQDVGHHQRRGEARGDHARVTLEETQRQRHRERDRQRRRQTDL